MPRENERPVLSKIKLFAYSVAANGVLGKARLFIDKDSSEAGMSARIR